MPPDCDYEWCSVDTMPPDCDCHCLCCSASSNTGLCFRRSHGYCRRSYGSISEQSASPDFTRSTADVTQAAIKSEIKKSDMPALEEISPTTDLGVTRVVSAVQLEDTSTLTPAEVEVLRARQLEEHREVLSPAIPSVPDTPDTSSTPTGTSQGGQTKKKYVATSQRRQTKEKKTAETSQRTRTAVKKSTRYNRAPPPLRTDLFESLREIDVQQTLDQINQRLPD